MRFRRLLSISMIGLVTLGLMAILGGVLAVLGKSADVELSADLDRAQRVLEAVEAHRASLHAAQSAMVAEEPRLKAVVATEDIESATVRGVALDLRRALGLGMFVVTAADGRVLADVLHDDDAGADLGGHPLVQRALSQGSSQGVVVDGDVPFAVQARRVQFGATPVGIVLLGYAIDDQLAQDVAAQSGAAMVVLLEGKVIAAAGVERSEDLSGQMMQVPKSGPVDLRLGGDAFRAVALAMRGYDGALDLRYVLLASRAQAEAASRRLVLIVLLVGVVLLGLAVAVSARLAARLSRPVESLVAYTREIGAGAVPPVPRLGGALELETLGGALHTMAEHLESSRQVRAAAERMTQELEIARRLQTTLVGRPARVPGLEIAARMIPATEVGGDYYDVLPVTDGCWIGVGDVAGHGLNAGLTMLMIQSAVAALVQMDPAAEPSSHVTAVNAVLYDNVKNRLGRDEHATFTLLRYSQDGRVRYAGAHEPMLLVRADGRSEWLPNAGVWLAAVPDVRTMTPVQTVALLPGDLLVLYSDGIIEAGVGKGEQFGEARLLEAVTELRQAPVGEILERVLDRVAAWAPVQGDDVTLVLLRHTGP